MKTSMMDYSAGSKLVDVAVDHVITVAADSTDRKHYTLSYIELYMTNCLCCVHSHLIRSAYLWSETE